MTKKRFIGVAMCAFAMLAATARAAPNFSGVWKLDRAKSEFGQMAMPDVFTRTINHNDPVLQISTYQKGSAGEVTSELQYTTDGKTVENKGSKGSAKWDGDNLVVDSVRDFQGGEVKSHDVWTLSADGKSMTVKTHVSLPGRGDLDLTLVFDKQ